MNQNVEAFIGYMLQHGHAPQLRLYMTIALVPRKQRDSGYLTVKYKT